MNDVEIPASVRARAALAARFIAVTCPFCQANAIMVCRTCEQVIEWNDREDAMLARARHACDPEVLAMLAEARSS